MKRLRGCAWTAVVAVVAFVAIAAPSAQVDVPRLLDSAETLLRAWDDKQAQPLFERALDAARASGREHDVARALLGIGDIAQRQRRAAAGRAGVIEALAIVERLQDERRIADAYYLLARIETAAGNRPAALAHAQRALAISAKVGDHRGIAVAAVEVAGLQHLEVDAERLLLERAAAAARAAGDRRLEGQPLHNLADRLFGVGRYEEALELLTRAAAAYEATGARVALGTVYNSIGRVYRAHGRLDAALTYQKAALQLHRTGEDRFALVQSLNAVAVVSQRLSDYATARSHLQEALEIATAMPFNASAARAQDFLRANMAALLGELGELEPAAAALEQVIAGGRDSFPSIRYAQLSMVYDRLGRATEALAAAEQSAARCGEAKIACIQALTARSNALAALGRREAALADLSLSLRGIEELRAQLVPSDLFKQDFSTSYRRAYSSAIARQLDARLERESLETAELARSRAFLDLLASRSIAASATAAGATLPLTLRGSGSSGAASPVTTAPANAGDLIRTAERLRSSLLLYWVGEAETFIWVVTPGGGIHARRVAVTRQRLQTLVRGTAPFAETNELSRSPSGPAVLRDSTAAWRALYTLLIAPVRGVLPGGNGALITIVPHDVLASLSFAGLQNAGGRYLLEDYTLHYAPAGALFQFTDGARRPQSRSGAMLMMSDPDSARRSTLDPPLPRLPGARSEAAAIRRHMEASRVLSLQGAAATESAVREHAPARSILHFAAHSVVSDDDPFASYLALGRSSASGDGDGVLTAHEVYRLNLSADLVVLSSCRSASGTVTGDGVAAFARAFVYAGAASLIASVWEVADEPSNRLLPAFYRAWLGGATKAASLRQGQLRLLADLRGGRVQVKTAVGLVPVPEHPVFWAGFVLFGEPD